MKIEIEKIGAVVIMRIIPSTLEGSKNFENYAREGQPLTAEVKEPGRYRYSWLEVRKKIL